jgi:8-oxo-dGTP diphosphatase
MQSFTKYYTEGVKVLVAIDCIIFGFDDDELKLLCFKRLVEPSAGEWSLLGSFVEENESLDDGAKRILHKLTGLDDIYMSQLYAHGDVQRDPGARVISVSYFALINIQEHNHQLVKDYGAQWFSISKLPNLVFDHASMVERALKILRREARYKPLGFELVPEKFTLPKLQSLYEAIYQKKIDNRNFRKSMKNTKVLEKLDEKEKESSKKGAHYYKFNQENYKKLSEMGYYFNVIV